MRTKRPISEDGKAAGFTPLLECPALLERGERERSGSHVPRGLTPRGQVTGFTLLEALIAISILAVILTFVYMSFFTAFKAKSYVEERNETYQVGDQIMFHLKRELTSAFLDVAPNGTISPYTYFVGIKDEWNDKPMDKLFFTTLSHVDITLGNGVAGSDFASIGYDTQIDQDKNVVYLIHRETPFFVTAPLFQGTGYVLTRSVQSFALYYFNPNAKQWTDEWDTRLPISNYLPYAVLVQLVLKDNNGVDVTFRDIIRLRMAQ